MSDHRTDNPYLRRVEDGLVELAPHVSEDDTFSFAETMQTFQLNALCAIAWELNGIRHQLIDR